MKNTAILTINIYQKFKNEINLLLLSLFGVAFSCRQKPSCSQYMVEQIKKNGIIIGLKKGLIRTVHCY